MRTVARERSVRRSSCYKHWIRYGLVLLGTAGAFGCDGDGVTDSGSSGPPRSPSYSLTVTGSTLDGSPGTSTSPTTVSLVRTTFTGAVSLSVENLPTGVTAHFSPASPLAGSSAELWLYVGGEVPMGTFTNLLVRGVASGLPDRTAPLTLTVSAPGYSLALSAHALSSAQGALSTSLTTVSLVRTGTFTGNVALSVENLPTGVDAYFYPASPLSGSSARLWLYAAGDAPAGTFSNLLVRGVAAGLPDRTAELTLMITVAPFVLTLSSPTLSIMQGTATTSMTVNLVRNDFTGPVTLGVDTNLHGTMPRGVTGTFAPNPTTGTRSALTFRVSAEAVPGVYDLSVYGLTGTEYFLAPALRLTITAAPSP
jgi:hypothetical protein